MKKYFQDIIPPEKRSIRNISIARKKIEEETAEEDAPPIHEKHEKVEHIPIHKIHHKEKFSFDNISSHKARRPAIAIWFVVAASIIALIFAIGSFGSGAIITLGTKTYTAAENQNFDANITPQDGKLTYVALEVKGDETVNVPASGEKDQKTKAGGTITISNANPTPQKLIATTRFQTADGLIYRIDKDVTVPSGTLSLGKLSPGTIDAHITADQVGETYNKANADFTLPGLKGDAKFKTVTAKTKTALSGGSTVKVAVVKDADLSKAIDGVKAKLQTELETKAKEQLPPNTFTIPGLFDVSYTTGIPVTTGTGKDANVKVQATYKLYAINSESFADMVIKDDTTGIHNFTVDTSAVVGKMGSNSDSKISFNLSGNVKINPTVDVETIKKEIAGKSKADTLNTLAVHKEFENVRIVLKPFWASTIPTNTDKIDVSLDKVDESIK